MAKGSIGETRSATDVVHLRDNIRELEIACADLKGRGETILDLLRLRDRLQVELERLKEEEGLDLRPERTRLETVDNILVRKTPAINRELRSSGGLAAAREKEKPSRERWWWYLDLFLAAKRRKSVTKALATVAVVLAILLGANYYLDKRYGMTPEEKQARTFMLEAEERTRAGEMEEAAALYEQAVAVAPSGEAYVALGVLYESLGDATRSEQALRSARSVLADPAGYQILLAKGYMELSEMDSAMDAINVALEHTPSSAQGYMVRGSIFEMQDKVAEAIEDYQYSADLASEQGQDELYVLTKMRLGMLMQRGPSAGMFSGPGF